MTFKNKVALVTGGGSGIGRGIALRLAKDGAKVIVIGRSEQTLIESANQHNNISYMVADVSRSDDISRLLTEVNNQFQRLDILVNNAGVAPVTPLSEIDMAEFDHVFNVNVETVQNSVSVFITV